jgi:hypothetical protein
MATLAAAYGSGNEWGYKAGIHYGHKVPSPFVRHVHGFGSSADRTELMNGFEQLGFTRPECDLFAIRDLDLYFDCMHMVETDFHINCVCPQTG